MEEDHFAPLGMSQTDFNAMIRRRNLADLTGQLVEQGRVIVPETPTVPRNAAQLLRVENSAANTPELLAADGHVARRSSSVYSRDIDGHSPPSTALADIHCSSHTIPQSRSPIVWPLLSRRSSTRASLSSTYPAPTSSNRASVSSYNSGTAAPRARYWPLQPHPSGKTLRMSVTESNARPSLSQSTPSRATSIDTYCSGAAAPKAKYRPLEIDPSFTPRVFDADPQSLPAAASVVDKVRVSNPMPQRQTLHEHPLGDVLEAYRKGGLDLPKAIGALLQKYGRRAKLQELQPPVDRFVELARLRRATRTLEFDFNDAIMLASDLTSVVHVPPFPSLQGLQEVEEADDVVNVFETHESFRWRLAKTVHNRLESLERELRVGDVRKIEHWYKEVVDLVGWRDEDESRMPWSWLENDGFF